MRRYSSKNKVCYNCGELFDSSDLQSITVMSINNQFEQRLVCQDCLDSQYDQCCHTEQHLNQPFKIDTNLESTYEQYDGKYYCNQCCDKFFVKCDLCNMDLDKTSNETKIKDGIYYCEQCYYEQFCSCQVCGDEIRKDDGYWTFNEKGYEIIVCDNCKDPYQFDCDNCSETVDKFHEDWYETNTGENICENCYQNYYFYCDNCCEIYKTSDYYGGSDNDGIYCIECWVDDVVGREIVHKTEVDPQKEKDRVQYDYTTKIKPKLKKRLVEKETKEFIGVELQLENSNEDKDETTSFIDQVSRNKKLICKVDGSLDSKCGVQINTVPCTYEYHLKTFGWQHVFNIINKYNMTNVQNSGLHFHISKNNFTSDQQKGLDYFVNNCVSYLGAIGGRDYSNQYYCQAEPNKSEEEWGKNVYRHRAVNFHNTNSVELRFPKATSNYSIFKKRLSMVHNICKLVKLFSFDDLKILDQENLTYLFVQLIKEM